MVGFLRFGGGLGLSLTSRPSGGSGGSGGDGGLGADLRGRMRLGFTVSGFPDGLMNRIVYLFSEDCNIHQLLSVPKFCIRLTCSSCERRWLSGRRNWGKVRFHVWA